MTREGEVEGQEQRAARRAEERGQGRRSEMTGDSSDKKGDRDVQNGTQKRFFATTSLSRRSALAAGPSGCEALVHTRLSSPARSTAAKQRAIERKLQVLDKVSTPPVPPLD